MRNSFGAHVKEVILVNMNITKFSLAFIFLGVFSLQGCETLLGGLVHPEERQMASQAPQYSVEEQEPMPAHEGGVSIEYALKYAKQMKLNELQIKTLERLQAERESE